MRVSVSSCKYQRYLSILSNNIQVVDNTVSAGKEIDKILDYLSNAIFRIESAQNKKLKASLDEDDLDRLAFTMVNLSAAIVSCLIISIELAARNIKG